MLHTLKVDGDTIEVGETIATIDEDGKAVSKAEVSEKADSSEEPVQADGLSPAVRRLVTENDLDPAAITGTGKDGRLTKEDVLAYLESEVSVVSSDDEPQEAQKSQKVSAQKSRLSRFFERWRAARTHEPNSHAHCRASGFCTADSGDVDDV